MYQELNKNKPFKYMHCWKVLQECQKWGALRASISQGGVVDETQIPGPDPTPRPTGNKKAKVAAHKAEAPSALQESLATFMASSNVLKEKMYTANNERWDMYYTVQGHKMKELQQSRGVKEMKIKEMQENREL